jgi:uncharacterized protein YjiS (DUF1127 family)
MFLSTIIERLNAYIRYRETVRELSKLTDRELDDLGITRTEIRTVAREHAAA